MNEKSSMNDSVEFLREMKAKAEKEIQQALDDFRWITGFSITRINVNNITLRAVESSTDRIVDQTVEAEIELI